jgi:DNA mismatch repair ATPase MutS
LKDIKQTAEEVAKRLDLRAKAKDEGDMVQFSEREMNFKAEIKSLQDELEQTIKSNMEEELGLRKKKFKIENEVDAWIQKYDQDMEEKQGEIDDITAIYSEEKVQLNELQVRFHQLQSEYARILEERKKADQVREKEEHERMMKVRCATKIQSLWRGHRVRRQLKEQVLCQRVHIFLVGSIACEYLLMRKFLFSWHI